MSIPAGSQYVALGSSFAAGPGIRPRAEGSPRAAGRSAANYAHLVASRLSLELTDVSYGGATTLDVLGRGKQPSQIDALTADTRLVTFTGGGNDVGYIPILFAASLPSWTPLFRNVLTQGAAPSALAEKFAAVRKTLAEIATEVARRSPDATLVFVDYLTILPPDSTIAAGRISPSNANLGRSVADQLAAATSEVAAENGALLVTASVRSRDHHAWSAEPWTTRFRLAPGSAAPLHPTAAGMRAVAEAVVERVG